MKVKFTEPVLNRVVYIINPNSDYNFGFIPNKETNRKYAERLNGVVDEFDL